MRSTQFLSWGNKVGIGKANLIPMQTAVDECFEGLEKIDESLHRGTEMPYEDVAEKIDTATAAMNNMATK